MASQDRPLGFRWNTDEVWHDAPTYSVERALFRFRQSLPEYVWDAAVLEGNPFTYPEVQTLMDGVTVGGHRLADEQQVLNLAAAAKSLSTGCRRPLSLSTSRPRIDCMC